MPVTIRERPRAAQRVRTVVRTPEDVAEFVRHDRGAGESPIPDDRKREVRVRRILGVIEFEVIVRAATEQAGGVLGTADDPDHRRQRRVLQDAFRPSSIGALDDEIVREGEALWSTAFGADGEGDFVRLFAFPFPAIVIAVLLGVPRERRDDFGRWSDDIVNTLGGADPSLGEDAVKGIFSPLHALAANGRYAVLETAYNCGIDIDKPAANGMTCLMIAARAGADGRAQALREGLAERGVARAAGRGRRRRRGRRRPRERHGRGRRTESSPRYPGRAGW